VPGGHAYRTVEGGEVGGAVRRNGRSRLEDLPTSIAACLAAHAMNVGYRPIAKKGVPALERSRLSHVYQNYVLCVPRMSSTALSSRVALSAVQP
jgi:Tn3 transposase DDE domain